MNTWVLLRGLTRESRHWDSFPAVLQDEFPAARIVALDLPGNGRLNHLDSPTAIEAMAAHCRAELVRRGLAPPYRLLAMSLGAMVAVAWAAEQPHEIEACVLINTSLRAFSPFYQRLRPAACAVLSKLALFGGSDDEWERSILRLTSRHAAFPGQVLERWVAWRRECPVSRQNALRQLLAATRYRAPGLKPVPKMLVLASPNDALVDVRCSRQLARHWQCDIVEHPSAGHDLPLDDPAWVAGQVGRWTRQALPRP